MKQLLFIVLPIVLAISAGSASAQVVSNGNINLLPMYGGVKKSRSLQKADANFLTSCDQNFPNRKEAAAHHAKRGWEFFYANDFTTAIKRYNQAWLLDSSNASAYWGFGAIEGRQQHNTDALRYFQTSLRLDPANRLLLLDMALALLNRYTVTYNLPDLDEAIMHLQEYLTDTSNTKSTTVAYKQLAAAYFLKRDYSNAWKYVDQITALDANATREWELLSKLQAVAPR